MWRRFLLRELFLRVLLPVIQSTVNIGRIRHVISELIQTNPSWTFSQLGWHLSMSQERQDGSAKAVPSTSGFLTGNGGSLNQTDPNAPQKVGTDQLRDDMPSPSDVHGWDDRKQLSQQEPCQEQLSRQELSQQELSQQQSYQQEQDQGMNPLPGLKLAFPQGQFGESSGQTGACLGVS